MARRKLNTLAWIALLSGLVVLAVKTFVGDVYRISSSSMEPVFRKDELVFVLHDRSAPERFEPVVARVGGEFLVKRAVGIGGTIGEDLRIQGGDIEVDGRKLPPGGPRPAPVLLFDDGVLPIDDRFRHGEAWTRRPDGVLELDASGVPFGANAGLLRYGRPLRDGYLGADGELVEGLVDVPDLVVEVEFVVLEAAGRVRVGVLEGSDAFEFGVDLCQPGIAAARLRCESARSGTVDLGETLVPFEVGVPVRLRLSNLDDDLVVDWSLTGWDDTPPVLQKTHATVIDPKDKRVGHFERAYFGGEGCRLELRHLRIYRDLYWTAQGEYAVERSLTLQPHQVFLLGDNSHQSHDSRYFGAIDESQIVGRPVMVLWPPSSARRVR